MPAKKKPQLPACARGMGCLCAFHACGAAIHLRCDTSEKWAPLANMRMQVERLASENRAIKIQPFTFVAWMEALNRMFEEP